MKVKPQTTPGSEPHSVRPGDRERQAARPDQTMRMEFQTRKARGRLSREDQRRLGDVLQRVYDDVVRQGVPDRFKDLIDQLSRNDGIADADGVSGHGSRSQPGDSGADHGMHAKGGDKSRDPG